MCIRGPTPATLYDRLMLPDVSVGDCARAQLSARSTAMCNIFDKLESAPAPPLPRTASSTTSSTPVLRTLLADGQHNLISASVGTTPYRRLGHSSGHRNLRTGTTTDGLLRTRNRADLRKRRWRRTLMDPPGRDRRSSNPTATANRDWRSRRSAPCGEVAE
jgi:hypothetical protein